MKPFLVHEWTLVWLLVENGASVDTAHYRVDMAGKPSATLVSAIIRTLSTVIKNPFGDVDAPSLPAPMGRDHQIFMRYKKKARLFHDAFIGDLYHFIQYLIIRGGLNLAAEPFQPVWDTIVNHRTPLDMITLFVACGLHYSVLKQSYDIIEKLATKQSFATSTYSSKSATDPWTDTLIPRLKWSTGYYAVTSGMRCDNDGDIMGYHTNPTGELNGNDRDAVNKMMVEPYSLVDDSILNAAPPPSLSPLPTPLPTIVAVPIVATLPAPVPVPMAMATPTTARLPQTAADLTLVAQLGHASEAQRERARHSGLYDELELRYI
jgi:hypothetical protein